MITVTNNVFHLETRSSSYVFAISPKGIGEHLYYGPRLANPVRDAAALMQKRYVPRKGEVSLSEKEWEVNLNDTPLEASTEGSGDFRTPFVSVLANLNCATSLDLRYKSSETFKGIKRMDCGLPQAIGGEDECHGVRVDYEDSRADVILSLYYTVFPDADAIIRRAVLRNTGKRPLSVTSLASLQLDLFDCDYTLTLIGGPWGREHRPRSQRLSYGKIVNESRSGFTGQKANTFLLERSDRSIITGLLYSADHKAVIEVTEYCRTHVISGINNDTVRPVLAPGEAFETPEAFLILGRDRVTAQSHLYSFAENYVIKGTWKNRLRPVMYSSAKSFGLDIRQDRLLEEIALAGRMGFELFVLDDGWFGVRRDKTDSCGDWSANTMKLPGGLAQLSRACHRQGMLFGLFISPEVISSESRLALEHPDWIVRNPRKKATPSEQGGCLIDLTRPEVYDYLLDLIKELIERAGIDHLKWNLGCQMADIWSPAQTESLNGTWRYRYICAFYRMQRTLSACFPNLLIENVSDTSPRFDLGLLAYSSLLGLSALSDPFENLDALSGASLIVPPSCITSMVCSRRWNLEGRWSSFSTAFNTAIFGTPCYSIDLKKLTSAQRQAVTDQISFYKMHRATLQYGLYRMHDDGNRITLTASSPDRSDLIMLVAKRSTAANEADDIIRFEDADENALYRVSRREEEEELFLEDDYTAPALEQEVYIAGGDTLKWAGVRLIEQYTHSAYSEDLRVMGDHSTRLYTAQRVDQKE